MPNISVTKKPFLMFLIIVSISWSPLFKIKFDGEELEQISTIVDDRSYTNREVFEMTKYMTYDPFNNRFKVFNKDFTFRVP